MQNAQLKTTLRGSRIETLGAIHVGTSPKIDSADPKSDFFSNLLGNVWQAVLIKHDSCQLRTVLSLPRMRTIGIQAVTGEVSDAQSVLSIAPSKGASVAGIKADRAIAS